MEGGSISAPIFFWYREIANIREFYNPENRIRHLKMDPSIWRFLLCGGVLAPKTSQV